jgi:hypothetical protein
VKQDAGAVVALYGAAVDASAILSGTVPPPKEATSFLAEVHEAFPDADVRRGRGEPARALYDQGSKLGMRVVGIERPSNADAP